ncbi:MAG: PQQ-binding-like beta-propeller repeat protein [bacterium]
MISVDSDFTAGRDYFSSTPSGVSKNGEAARLASSGTDSVYAIWRIPLNGSQPGTVSADVNLLANEGGGSSSFYLAVSNYATGRWEWHGPFTDSHVRISLAQQIANGGMFLSSAQNTFVCILTSRGGSLDVVDIGLDAYDMADSTAPQVPTGLTATPVQGGLELRWLAVDNVDLAGYRIYHSGHSFVNPASVGVQRQDMLEGSTRCLLPAGAGARFVRISALDHSGNESAASELVSASPLPGTPLEIKVGTDLISGLRNVPAMLSASGASEYDFDTNGDGVFDVTGNTSGKVQIDTSTTGVIRPRVRARDASGTAIALGSVSLIISGNTRPVAHATINPQTGPAPLTCTLLGWASDEEENGVDFTYAWDFDGDGLFEDDTNELVIFDHVFSIPGFINVGFRVEDSEGLYDIANATVYVTQPLAGPNDSPIADLLLSATHGDEGMLVNLDASGSADPDGTIEEYLWDFNGDGAWDSFGSSSRISHHFNDCGVFAVTVGVVDERGGMGMATASLRVNETFSLPSAWPGYGQNNRNTGRSQFTGPQSTVVAWTFPAGDSAFSSPVIGIDGSIIFGSYDGKLYSVNNDGAELWSISLGASVSSAAIGHDGTIYAGCLDDQLYALYPEGGIKWSYFTGGDISAPPCVGPDGTIYFGSSSNFLYALNPDGTLKWSYDCGEILIDAPALGRDGTVYVKTTTTLHAVNPDGSLQWTFLGGLLGCSPSIGSDGTIYFSGYLDNKLYAINPDGSLQWAYDNGDDLYGSTGIAADGTIYVTAKENKLLAISPDGNLDWDFTTASNILPGDPVIGADGVIYCTLMGGLLAVNPDGSQKFYRNQGHLFFNRAAIAADGTLFCGGQNFLFAFRNVVTL